LLAAGWLLQRCRLHGGPSLPNNRQAVPTCSCPSGQTLCGGTCINAGFDNNNCGSCGNKCGAGTKCCSGACVFCPLGGQCAGTQPACECPTNEPTTCVFEGEPICVNLNNANLFCGSCGHSCRTGEDGGETCCNGTCVNLQTNEANCGQCGNLCATVPGGKAVCCNGICKDANNDPQNCGGCSRGCAKFSGCVNGVCRAPCRPGQRCDTGKCNCPLGFGCKFGTCRRVKP
jgi:hypothetical protein